MQLDLCDYQDDSLDELRIYFEIGTRSRRVGKIYCCEVLLPREKIINRIERAVLPDYELIPPL